MPSEHASAELLGALSRLLSALTALDRTFERTGRGAVPAPVVAARAEVIDQLSDYVIPRLVQLEAPLLTVVGGSTGAGKSTLVNSLVGEPVTESGVLRPTTRSPVLVHHPEEEHWFQPDRILPQLPRTEVTTNDVYALRLVSSDLVPRGLAILDAPDIDSIDADNRQLAAQLLAAADLWLFVTSAARYADQVPWDYLARAAERASSVAVVLDRTHEEQVVEVRGHLARMMTSRGLSDSPLFTVSETQTDESGLLPRSAVAPIRTWLHELAGDPMGRASVVHATLDGAVRHNVMAAFDIADGMDAVVTGAASLHAVLDAAFESSSAQLRRQAVDGSLLRGRVLSRWQEFVGSGELLRSVEERVTRLRDRIVENVTGRRAKSDEVLESVTEALQGLVREHVERAVRDTATGWTDSSAGASSAAEEGLDRVSREVAVTAERLARDWRDRVVDMVRSQGADKRMSATFLAVGVNGVSVAVMVLAVSSEAQSRDRSLALAERLLSSIFEAAPAAALVQRAATALLEVVGTPLDAERRRLGGLIDSPARLEALRDEVRGAARQAEYARHLDFFADGGKHA
ncbi:dynamin family protein [Aeromicrobium halocynthiae]|uniref:Dynamin family protein n=1 Tax=Aeromicrobium halocynthiae TaxID=560557 RepID=A0ABN2W4I4_9ACTN